MPVILLRSINNEEGQGYGTRAVVRRLGRHILDIEIAVGAFKGQQAYVP